MVVEVDTAAVRDLLGTVQLLDVQPQDDYDEEHLSGAIRRIHDVQEDEPVVVYGTDAQDDLPHRAAAELERRGCTDVRVYRGGMVAWLAEGLPSEGRRRPEQRIAAIATRDVPTVPGDATVADAASAFGQDDDVAVVLDRHDVVLGILRRETLGLPPDTPVADGLQPGPSTFRPSLTIAELVDYLRKSDERRAIVSTPSGRFLGLIRREDVLDA